jgi:hypothetical protein
MKTSTEQKQNGIQWTLWTKLGDLDFVDDLALLSQNHSKCRSKPILWWKIKKNWGNNKALKVNTASKTPIKLEGEVLEEVESFTYLGSIVDKQRGADANVKIRVRKVRAAVLQLKEVWTSRYLSTNTTIRLFNSNVKSVLLYGGRDLEDHSEHHKENPDIHQQLSEKDPPNTLA